MSKLEIADTTNLVSLGKVLPSKVFVVPIKSRPVFPGIFMPLIIEGEKYRGLLRRFLKQTAL